MLIQLWRQVLLTFMLVLGFIGFIRPAHGSTALAGKLIYLQGQVYLQRASLGGWEKPQLGDSLFAGDVVKTGPASVAAILCVDESQIKLHENTVLELKSVMPSPRLSLAEVVPAALEKAALSLYGVSQGEVWLRNNKETFHFELETPAVTAGIRGTEFNLQVRPDGTTYLTLLQGKLRLANPQGELILNPGEEGIVHPGRPPTKRLVLQPEDAVQWSLYYPGIFSYRDISLANQRVGTGARSGLVKEAALFYDQGRLSEAREAVAAVLRQAPGDEQALTLLGWIHLQENAPLKALQTFQQVTRPDALAVVGLALARYRLGELLPAYELVKTARQQLTPSPLLWTMEGYFALLATLVQESQACLEHALELAPEYTLARTLLAQMWLVQNRKAAARQEASRTLAQTPQSPAALFTMALVEIAHFNPSVAKTYLEKAIKADPRFVPAYLYLAKIWLGADYLERAEKTIDAASRLAPEEGEVLSMAGFVKLGLRDYQGAKKLFDQAIEANPALGEPHLGIGIYYFRYREPKQGLAEMLTATLLEPRVSLYQSTLGKALYQVRAFDKALEVYDYAKALDKNDPTPHLYKGIALTDLNRPGEAIQEINQSIALNDNNAIFRSRLMLDRDLAVRNYNLSRAYNQLGLGDWAYSKAVNAVKKDPLNSSARLFLANAYLATRQRLGSAGSELLLYRLLSPANQNTFTVYNDYTPMFEMPYLRVQAQGGIGTWCHSRAIQDHSLEVYGGIPGLAFDIYGSYFDDDGFRAKNGDDNFHMNLNLVKWEPTVRNSVLGGFRYSDAERGDTSNLNDFGFVNSPNMRQFPRLRIYELGYVHRFNPKATFLSYFTYANNHYHRRDKTFDTIWFLGLPIDQTSTVSQRYDQEFYNLQFQQQLILADHTLIGGVDYFWGHLKYKYDELLEYSLFGIPLASYLIADNFRPPNRSYSLYLQDYWQVTPQLLAELGVFFDHTRNSRAGFADPVSLQRWNPRLGLNYQVNADHTLRLVLQHSLNTHNLVAPLLVPAEIASFPWQINIDDGSEMREFGVAWEAQWNPLTFSVLRLNANRIFTPQYEVDSQLEEHRVWWGWKRYTASFTVNRILSPSWGLTTGVVGKKFDPSISWSHDFSELNALLQLSFLHRSGWQGFFRTYVIKQDLTDRGDSFYGLADAGLGYEFPGKRGFASLEVTNIFDRHFYFQKEFVTFDVLYPVRRVLFKLALYF
ncbi:MAG: tetratricopeptide repeat protein [Deltaproteobacteria bacterium]|nr:tetratricopeptide repeat protein [Deltaproteobacteria bacterium]